MPLVINDVMVGLSNPNNTEQTHTAKVTQLHVPHPDEIQVNSI